LRNVSFYGRSKPLPYGFDIKRLCSEKNYTKPNQYTPIAKFLKGIPKGEAFFKKFPLGQKVPLPFGTKKGDPKVSSFFD